MFAAHKPAHPSGESLLHLSPGSDADARRLEEMVRELRAANTRVHQAVLTVLAPVVERWARGILGPHVDPRDHAQEALCEIAAALHRYEGRSNLATFAYRITLRVALRARKRYRPPDLDPLDEAVIENGGEDPSQSSRRREITERLYRHLDRMNERRRTALILVDLLEMTPSEAAEVMGVRPPAMRNLLLHARRELRDRATRDPFLTAWMKHE